MPLLCTWMQGNGTITLRKQVELFAETKATIIRTGLVDRERLDDLLARSLFLISTGGNDFNAFDDGGVPMSQAPEFIAGMVAGYLKYINVRISLSLQLLILLLKIASLFFCVSKIDSQGQQQVHVCMCRSCTSWERGGWPCST